MRAPGPGTIDLVLSTDGQHPDEVARRIRAACPDQLIAPASPPV